MEYLHGEEIEFKAEGEDEGVFEGYAALFNKKDRGHEIILPDAFTKSIHGKKPKKIKMLRGHDQNSIIGAWDEMKVDAKGLFVKGHLLMELAAAKEAFLLMKEGLLDSLSIGFIAIVESWDSKKSARVLEEVELLEISPVAIPQQAGALITAVRSFGPEQLGTKIDLERALRNAGFSKKTAQYICAGWTPPACRNDEGKDDVLGAIQSLRQAISPTL